MSKSRTTRSANEVLSRNFLAPSPKIITLGPSCAGRSTLVYSLLNEKLSMKLKKGIGEFSHTTGIPCTFCLDDRIENSDDIALLIDRKFIPPYSYTNTVSLKNDRSSSDTKDMLLNEHILRTMFSVIEPLLLARFISMDYKAKDTIDSITTDDILDILEPENDEYHLEFLLTDNDFFSDCISSELIPSDAVEKSTIDSSKKQYGLLKKLFTNAFSPLLEKLESDFKNEYTRLRKEAKYNKVEASQLRKYIFESIVDSIPSEGLTLCRKLFKNINKAIEIKLEAALGTENYSKLYDPDNYSSKTTFERTVSLSLSSDDDCRMLSELLDPYNSFNLIIDHIYIACSPNDTLKGYYSYYWEHSDLMYDEHGKEYDQYPFRLSITDTAFSTIADTNTQSFKEAIESALVKNPDCIFFLFDMECSRKALYDNTKKLAGIIPELSSKNKYIPFYILFTKADRLAESILFKEDTSVFRLQRNDFEDHIPEAGKKLDCLINNLQDVVNIKVAELHEIADKKNKNALKEYVTGNAEAPNMIVADWLSLSPVKSIAESGSKKSKSSKKKDTEFYSIDPSHFSPDYLFSKTSSIVFDIIKKQIDKKDRHLYHILEPKDLSQPSIQVKLSKNPAITKRLNDEIRKIQEILTCNKDIVNGYVIPSDKPMTFHGASVKAYYEKLRKGLGHVSKSSTFGNFSINMRGLLRRVILKIIPDFETLNADNIIEFNTDNLPEKELRNLHSFITGEKNKLSDSEIKDDLTNAFLEVFSSKDNATVYKYLINQVAYGLSFGNRSVSSRITLAFFGYKGYSNAIASMQQEFFDFFSSDSSQAKDSLYPDFATVFKEELEKAMTEMLNYAFVIC